MRMKEKNRILIFMLLVPLFCLIAFFSCRKDDASLIPSLKILNLRDITQTTVTCDGIISFDGGIEIIARGFCWSALPNPTLADHKTIDGAGTGNFSSTAYGLNPRTKYFIRAYATTSAGTSYGEYISFVTQIGQVPVLTTNSISNITRTSATCSAEITSDGGLPVTLRGVCYSTNSNPTLSGNFIASGSGTGSYIINIAGLDKGKTYFIRAYASNSIGTTYGNELSFATTVLPTLTTSAGFDIKGFSAKAGGIITNNGGTDQLISGLCWSTSPEPTLANDYNNSLTQEMENLLPNTVYYVRAYATNSTGTSYGNEISFNSGYTIGTSLGGGIVFYNDGQNHGLICAPADQSHAVPWGCDGTVIGAFSTNLKSGIENTDKIVAGCSSEYFAAKICKDLILKKYSDWYLPSAEELNHLFQNLYKSNLGNFTGNYYWSSSEYGDIQAWLMDFSTGKLHYSSKSHFISVRAVRSF